MVAEPVEAHPPKRHLPCFGYAQHKQAGQAQTICVVGIHLKLLLFKVCIKLQGDTY